MLFLFLERKSIERKNRFCVSEGFFGTVSAHYRSHPLALALRGQSSDTLDEAKR
jgi:hypothetical protein